MADEARFNEAIHKIYERHTATLAHMAKGVIEFKQEHNLGVLDELPPEMRPVFTALDTFYTSRIGIRTLMEQHMALHDPMDGFVGIVETKMCPVSIARAAAEEAAFVCRREFGDAPDVRVVGPADFSFAYVPSHLHHIIFELIKNSMRATVETHGDQLDMPPVKVVVSGGSKHEDVTIKVADEGGGIPRSEVHRIWSYFFTTASSPFSEQGADFSTDSPLAGLGYGLPLSRLYARYFGGDLSLVSMQGYGTDCYVHLRRIPDAEEPLQDFDRAPSAEAEETIRARLRQV